MFETRLTEFANKNQLDAEVVQELVQIFNEALVEIGQAILKDVPNKTVNTVKKSTGKVVGQRWASKVAEAFAKEKDLTLDDFPGIEKVTKQHMIEHIKTKEVKDEGSPTPSVPKSSPKRKVQCNGLTGKGEHCTRTGTIKPDGCNNYYCFRHADSWKDFETCVSSDSDEDDLKEEEVGDEN